MKYPTAATVRRFYKNFNYGLFLSSQMNSSLFINRLSKDRKLHTPDTVAAMQRQIASNFGTA